MKNRKTIFSPCRSFRYTLWREWDQQNDSYAMVIGLNPSTADEIENDPTIDRCINFAKYWGYGALCMTNLFAFRATKPPVMKAHPSPIGPDNDLHLVRLAKGAAVIVAAWGVDGKHLKRDLAVKRLIPDLKCLAVTNGGHPYHPLYLPGDLKPVTFESAPRTADLKARAKARNEDKEGILI